MIGPVARAAEVVGGPHQPLAEVVLPEPVDDHAGQQAAGAAVDVGQPLGHRRAAVGRAEDGEPSGSVIRLAAPVRPAIAGPGQVLLGRRPARQDLEEARRDDLPRSVTLPRPSRKLTSGAGRGRAGRAPVAVGLSPGRAPPPPRARATPGRALGSVIQARRCIGGRFEHLAVLLVERDLDRDEEVLGLTEPELLLLGQAEPRMASSRNSRRCSSSQRSRLRCGFESGASRRGRVVNAASMR